MMRMPDPAGGNGSPSLKSYTSQATRESKFDWH